MKIIAREKDETTLVPEKLNDLWYLYISVGGLVLWQKTLRTKIICRGREVIKGKKKPVCLGISAEKLSWEGNKVRVTGKITEGEERHKHHSFYLKLNEKTKVVGPLENIPKPAKREALVCVCDRSRASLGNLRGGKIQPFEEIQSKGRETEYFKEVANKILRAGEGYILIAGPDKAKDKVAGFLDRTENVFLDQLASTGTAGFEEALKRSVIKEVFEKQREDAERKAVTEIMAEIKKAPEKACYGLDVAKAPERAARVLVLSDFVKKYENVLKAAMDCGSEIQIVDGSKDYSRELRQFELVGVCRW
ncbi:MAG: hypothetical protein ACP5E4_04065 [Candidatus Aenigmatarchaeota archaeon]